MNFEFVLDKLNNYKNNLNREWLLTNGLGGYGSSSIIGAHSRIHQGYLIASLQAPVDRVLAFSKTNERLVCGSRIYDLTTAQHKGPYTSEFNQGNMHLSQFKYDGNVTFIYEAGGMRLTKTITLVHEKNQCTIAYTLENNGPAAGVVITPLMNYRKHSAHMTIDDLRFELPEEVFQEIRNENNGNVGFYYSPVSNSDVRISLISAGCEMVKRNNVYDENMELQHELDDGKDGLDCHIKPYDFVMEVAAGGVSKASFVCSVDVKSSTGRKKVNWPDFEEIDRDTAFVEAEKEKNRVQALIETAGFDEDDELAQVLTVAANQFIVKRKSSNKKSIIAGYPWLTDRGRDAMVAFTGICLETGQFDDAKSILLTFAKYIKNGLLPNEFPEEGGTPSNNTADASLWYFYAVYNYLKYVDNDEAWKFVEDEIYPYLQEIMGAYRKGTSYSIKMDDDALMQVGKCKPVDINALWYNALMTMEEISRGIARRTHNKPENYLAYAGGCSQLAIWVKEAFNTDFWYEEGGYLYNSISEEEKDTALCPDQLFAISLPFTMLDPEKEKSVVKVVKDNLYVGVGLKSLEEGTAWGFMLGAFIEAYLKVGGHSAQAIEEAKAMFEPVEKHLVTECIGNYSENFNSEKPYQPKGCFAQASSVGEILRAYALLKK